MTAGSQAGEDPLPAQPDPPSASLQAYARAVVGTYMVQYHSSLPLHDR